MLISDRGVRVSSRAAAGPQSPQGAACGWGRRGIDVDLISRWDWAMSVQLYTLHASERRVVRVRMERWTRRVRLAGLWRLR